MGVWGFGGLGVWGFGGLGVWGFGGLGFGLCALWAFSMLEGFAGAAELWWLPEVFSWDFGLGLWGRT